MVCTYPVLITHSSGDGYEGGYDFFAIGNQVATSKDVQGAPWDTEPLPTEVELGTPSF